ncbi:MAG: rhodanese-like domain-containing protein [Myxococcota bacterium]
MKVVDVREARGLLASGDLDLVDVREGHEWETGHLPNARHVPLGTVKADPKRALPRDGVLLVCARGGRSATAAALADDLGYQTVYSIDGGTMAWQEAGLPIEVPPISERVPVAAHEALSTDLDVPELDPVIGANLRELRTQRGLSLDAVARMSGLSRTLLGQVELGTNPPSLGVVWRLAKAFDVPFATLLSAPTVSATAVLRKAKAKVLMSADGRFSSRALFPFGEPTKVEFYELWLAGHARDDAEPHARGTKENLVVTRGQVVIEVAGQRHELGEGDALVFPADVPHAYVNPASAECWMHLVMTYL